MNLKIDCLGKTPLTYEAVAGILGMKIADPGLRQVVKNLCLSHERLRAELEGVEKLIGCPHCGPHCDLMTALSQRTVAT